MDCSDEETRLNLSVRCVVFGLIAVSMVATVAVAQVSPPAADQTPAAELLAFHVKDSDFRPVEVAPWVRENVVQGFIPIEMIDEAATWGVNVVHGGGPDPYFPLMKDDPNSGP